MGTEDEIRSMLDANERQAKNAERNAAHQAERRRTNKERALAELRQVAVEANQILLSEGLKPARLVKEPPLPLDLPKLWPRKSLSANDQGWVVLDNVVIDLAGSLWSPRYSQGLRVEKAFGIKTLDVDPKGGVGHLPTMIQCDARGLYTEVWGYSDDRERLDLLHQVKHGYARLLQLHRARQK